MRSPQSQSHATHDQRRRNADGCLTESARLRARTHGARPRTPARHRPASPLRSCVPAPGRAQPASNRRGQVASCAPAAPRYSRGGTRRHHARTSPLPAYPQAAAQPGHRDSGHHQRRPVPDRPVRARVCVRASGDARHQRHPFRSPRRRVQGARHAATPPAAEPAASAGRDRKRSRTPAPRPAVAASDCHWMVLSQRRRCHRRADPCPQRQNRPAPHRRQRRPVAPLGQPVRRTAVRNERLPARRQARPCAAHRHGPPNTRPPPPSATSCRSRSAATTATPPNTWHKEQASKPRSRRSPPETCARCCRAMGLPAAGAIADLPPPCHRQPRGGSRARCSS